MKDIINSLTMKELEQITYRALQKSFSQVMAKTLIDLQGKALSNHKVKSLPHYGCILLVNRRQYLSKPQVYSPKPKVS